MSAQMLLKNKALGALVLTALAVSASTLGCGSAEAMGRAPTTTPPPASSTQPAAPTSTAVVTDVEGAGGFQDGQQLGLRNGTILIDRLKQRTTDVGGCEAIPQLENALVRVSRSIRPPHRSRDAFISGFYSGYINAVRSSIHDLRQGCDSSIYSSGEFVGQLYGAVACQVQTVSAEALLGLELNPLYTGWSGGSSAVQANCRLTLRETIQTCSNGAELSTEIEAALLVSCSDASSLR